MARKRRKHQITRIRILMGTVLAIVIAAAVFLGVFRINKIEVLGANRYGAQEIKEALIYDFWTENTLYLAWKYRNAVTDAKTPYLDSIQAKVLSPGKVRLIVKEKTLSGYVQYAGENVYFDKNGIVLEITEEVYGDVPLVSGVTMEAPILYQKLPMDNTAQMGSMLKITELLIKAEFIPDNISFDENLNITLTKGTIDVKLGQNDCLDEKVANLVTIYQEVAGQNGTLNMETFTGNNETISFQPREEEIPVETEGEDTTQAGGEDGTDLGQDTGDDQAADGEDGQAAQEEGSLSEEVTASEDDTASEEVTGMAGFMVFDSNGTLRYDARVINGQVVDASGTPIPGCTVNENGNVVDAYWNEIDPYTGQLAQ